MSHAFGRGVPVLTYHSLDSSGSAISCSPRDFARHLGHLVARGVRTIGLGQLAEAWRDGRGLPRRSVVLTFDDGFANVLEHGIPRLRELGFGATVFAVAGYLGRDNGWPGQSPRVPLSPLMDAEDLRCLAAEGIEIGCHSFSHPPLAHLSPGELEREIVGSRRELEDILGRAVPTFAYPYGVSCAESLRLVRATYHAACGVELRTALPADDLHHLPRIDMVYFRGRLARLPGARLHGAYLGLRRAGRGLRAWLQRGSSAGAGGSRR